MHGQRWLDEVLPFDTLVAHLLTVAACYMRIWHVHDLRLRGRKGLSRALPHAARGLLRSATEPAARALPSFQKCNFTLAAQADLLLMSSIV